MRLMPALCVALMVAPALLPTTLAQAPAPLLQDPAGDVVAVADSTSQPVPQEAYPELDLLALHVAEDAASFTFTIQVTDVRTGQETMLADGLVIEVRFLHEGREFRLQGSHQLPRVGDFTFASLWFRDAADADWENIWWRSGALTLDPSAETYSIQVLRDELADRMGTAPFPDRFLERFEAVSGTLLGEANFNLMGTRYTSPVRVTDRMPDAATEPVRYAVQHGLRQSGHARLASDEPFRASNGEATTFLYTAMAHNIGEASDRFTLRTASVPRDWTVTIPVPTLDVEPDSPREVAVLVRIPFTHEHGTSQSFVLEMASATDPSAVGRMAMGVRFLAVPQPAGHHDTLHLHARPYNEISRSLGTVFTGNDGYVYMNTLAEVEGEIPQALSPQGIRWSEDAHGVSSWCVPLEPRLQMGLDFDLNRSGMIAVPVQSVVPMPATSLRATLLLLSAESRWSCYQAEAEPLATMNWTTPIDLPANSQAVLEGEFQAGPAADRVAYAPEQNLFLFVEVRALAAPNYFLSATAPRLAPGGQMTLPLLEFHDDVKAALTTLQSTALQPLGAQDRRANPGDTIVFPFSVANDGDVDRVLQFNATGLNAAWASVPAQAVVPPHSAARVELVVNVPEAARPAEMADIVLQARDVRDDSGLGLLRLLVVVTDEEVPSDQASVSGEAVEETPAPLVFVALGLLAAAVALRRRR